MNLLDSLSEAESAKIPAYWNVLESKFLGLDIAYFKYVYGTACWLQTVKSGLEGKKCLLGVSGAQGTGKSTFAKLLALTLDEVFGAKSLVLSLDDFYLSRTERQLLSKTIHPLLKTRGVPGTHDINMIQKVLRDAVGGQVILKPNFDKSTDDRIGFQETDCRNVDYILIEGWCWGVASVEEHELDVAINTLETERDQDGSWRQYVNKQLEYYQDLFPTDASIFLAVPDMQSVLEWRWQQESELKCGSERMSKSEIETFIQHFERLSQRMLQQMPRVVDLTLVLGRNHQIESGCLRAD